MSPRPPATPPGLIKNCKIGDCVIELGPDSAAPGAKIVVEAKEEDGYTLARGPRGNRNGPQKSRRRLGRVRLLEENSPAGPRTVLALRQRFIIVWDAEDTATDVFLKAGIIAARALCFRAERQSAAQQVDFETIDKAILEIEKRAGNLDEVRKSAETIQSSSDKDSRPRSHRSRSARKASSKSSARSVQRPSRPQRLPQSQ